METKDTFGSQLLSKIPCPSLLHNLRLIKWLKISELIHKLIFRSGTQSIGRGSPGRVRNIADALSRDNPLPENIREAMKNNREVFNLYMDEQRDLIRQHNAAVRRAVMERTTRLRAENPGRPIQCPDCGEEQSWGGLVSHVMDYCSNKRV